MFQRLKSLNLDSFLDPKLAEEQAKQNASKTATPAGASPSASGSRRNPAAGVRNASPAAKQSKVTDPLGVSGPKGPDPEEFVIGEDGSDMSRSATPGPVKENVEGAQDVKSGKAQREEKTATNTTASTKPDEDALPEDVRKRLAKLELLTQKYQDLLRNYRTAHARVAQIEPFESTLREHTPLTGISEPGALVEFLNQRGLQSDMVLEELKRITGEHRQLVGERDALKKELDQAEAVRSSEQTDGSNKATEAAKASPQENEEETSASRSELEALKSSHKEETQRHIAEINELMTENAQYHTDLSTCRLDLDAARYNLTRRERENNSLQSELATAKAELEGARKTQEEHEEKLKTGKYAQREEQRLKTYEQVVNQLRAQVKDVEEARVSAMDQTSELQSKNEALETEIEASRNIGSQMKAMENSRSVLEERSAILTKQLAEAERDRDDARRLAESKKGHEAAVASLRSQLKRAIAERDAAYQMILDCGKCKVPEDEDIVETDTNESRSRGTSDPSEEPDIGTLPSSADAQSVNGESIASEGKKKKKRKPKSKTKKTMSEADTTKDSTNPHSKDLAKMIEELKQHRDQQDDDIDETRLNLEAMIEERDQKLKDQLLVVRDREDTIERLKVEIDEKQTEIDRLQLTIRTSDVHEDEDGMKEENTTLRESLQEIGGELTGAKQAAKDAIESEKKLREQLEAVEAEASKVQKQLRDAKAECSRLSVECARLEKEISQVQADTSSTEELNSTRHKLESLLKEHEALQEAKDSHAKEIEQLKQQQTRESADTASQHKSLAGDFERMKSRADTLETDLNAANLLAQNRYKELTDIKQHYSRVQPEVKRLREEAAELKNQKSELDKANATVRKLEAKDRDLNAEIAEYKAQASKRDTEFADLKDKVKKARERNSALEDTYERSRKDIEEHQRTRDEAVDAREKMQQQLEKAQQERRSLKSQIEELGKQVKKATDESRGLRDEVQLKSAKHASAQSLMDSLENQSRELATQSKEMQNRCDGLEEELADAQRLLSERSREAETMRRLLADVEGRADSRVKEMRERLDLAVEERDRAEDEASSLGRKKAREVEDYKIRLRELERDVQRAHEAKTGAERAEQDLRTRQDDLERRFALAQTEVSEVRTAMTQLRDALDEGERQARELEKQKGELRKTLEERETRLERLQKSSKAMAEELRALQTSAKRQPSVQSSRSSMDARISSPSPPSRGPTISTGNGVVAADQGVDYVYLKNILLQFLEQKEKKHQMQLIPVLGMLLHFDKSEEAKWMSVVTAK